MLNLPKITEMHKHLPKKTIYSKFKMDTAAREKIDADISKITIVNEISPAKIHIDKGEDIKCFFVAHVLLKKKDFSDYSIITISKLIPQNILFVLEYGDKAKLAVYHTKLMQTSWNPKNDFSIELKGLNLDSVWQNIVTQVGKIEVEGGNTLEMQIEIDDKRQRLEKEIEKLEKQARRERQPKKKFEIVQEINRLKKFIIHNS